MAKNMPHMVFARTSEVLTSNHSDRATLVELALGEEFDLGEFTPPQVPEDLGVFVSITGAGGNDLHYIYDLISQAYRDQPWVEFVELENDIDR